MGGLSLELSPPSGTLDKGARPCPFGPGPWFAGRPPGDAQPEMAPLTGSLSGSSHFVPKQEAIRNTYQKSNLLHGPFLRQRKSKEQNQHDLTKNFKP